ncbi:MAG: hypothetical protein HFG60_02160 [Lachnospiraceae bacterium]|nr:hypothetical protein [Lachnospiraceae bacterium]
MNNIQEEFNRQAGNFVMEPGEYKGPLTINRPCTVDGSMSTLWAEAGPVLIVEAEPVTIKDLRVEVTGPGADEESRIAIKAAHPHTALSHVEVNGNLSGFAGEAPSWNLPPVVSLGTFAAETQNTFAFDITAPGEASLDCRIQDVELEPKRLTRGKNRIILKTASMRDNTILYGEILVVTKVARRIYVTGKSQKGALKHQDQPLDPEIRHLEQTLPVNPPCEAVAPAVEDAGVESIRRGQRVLVEGLQERLIKVVYGHQGIKRPLEIDSYVFMLQDNGKVRKDEDFIFFGNPQSEKGDVKGLDANGMPMVLVELAKTEPWVNKIAICFSIYGDGPGQDFSLVEAPALRVFDGEKERYRFPLSGLEREKTVVALEIYRYKGDWKFNFVGAGYHSGLKRLCESYGVEVE